MGKIECKICKEDDQSKLELHHLIPKFMGGTDSDGRVYLCKKHHGMVHNFVISKLWNSLSLEHKMQFRQRAKIMTLHYINTNR